jgi:hypothetical protein
VSGHLQVEEAAAALKGRTIVEIEIDDDGGGHFDEIRITLDNGEKLEIVSSGAYGEDSYVNLYRA